MKRLLFLLLSAVLALTACTVPGTRDDADALHIFYPTDLRAARGGDAIESVEVAWDSLPRDDLSAQAEEMVRRIMAGDKDHVSPIPAGTELLECRLAGGIVHLDFSYGYSRLSGMDLTMADYCLTLSLTELPNIYGVRITVMGKELAYRSGGVLLAGNVLLTSTEDVVRELAATLYFPDRNGELVREDRLLTFYEGQSRAGVVLEALVAGPETEGLLPLLPEGFTLPTVRTDQGVCYVNITGESAAALGGDAQPVLTAISRSIVSVEGISSVQYLLDGEPMA